VEQEQRLAVTPLEPLDRSGVEPCNAPLAEAVLRALALAHRASI
jgi:hypothetical protein